MHKPYRYLAFATLALALVSLLAAAAQSPQQRVAAQEARSADLLPNDRQRALSVRATPAAADKASPTLEEVGDVDSFGRQVRWLGLAQMDITLADTCPPPGTTPNSACAVLDPPGAVTSFNFDDVARITLPGKSADSLLCYWLSPFLTTTYDNPTAAPVIARLNFSPTLTVENPVLDDPALIDPMTGLPFGGSLLTGMTSSEWFEVPLAAGMQLSERKRDSAVCIAGFVSRRSLVQNYGLTEAQAKEFFKKKTTIRMNITGSAQYVQNALLIFGLRVVGD